MNFESLKLSSTCVASGLVLGLMGGLFLTYKPTAKPEPARTPQHTPQLDNRKLLEEIDRLPTIDRKQQSTLQTSIHPNQSNQGKYLCRYSIIRKDGDGIKSVVYVNDPFTGDVIKNGAVINNYSDRIIIDVNDYSIATRSFNRIIYDNDNAITESTNSRFNTSRTAWIDPKTKLITYTYSFRINSDEYYIDKCIKQND